MTPIFLILLQLLNKLIIKTFLWSKLSEDVNCNYNYRIIYGKSFSGGMNIVEAGTNNTVTLENLEPETDYYYYIQAVHPLTNAKKLVSNKQFVSTSKNDFLILVGESLYQNSQIQEDINTYVNDLKDEKIIAEVLRVFETDTSEGVNTCTNSKELKSLIRNKYNEGAKGFVLIGSAPDIPTPLVKY